MIEKYEIVLFFGAVLLGFISIIISGLYIDYPFPALFAIITYWAVLIFGKRVITN